MRALMRIGPKTGPKHALDPTGKSFCADSTQRDQDQYGRERCDEPRGLCQDHGPSASSSNSGAIRLHGQTLDYNERRKFSTCCLSISLNRLNCAITWFASDGTYCPPPDPAWA